MRTSLTQLTPADIDELLQICAEEAGLSLDDIETVDEEDPDHDGHGEAISYHPRFRVKLIAAGAEVDVRERMQFQVWEKCSYETDEWDRYPWTIYLGEIMLPMGISVAPVRVVKWFLERGFQLWEPPADVEADPAWWRGHAVGIRATLQRIDEALLGHYDGRPPMFGWEELTRTVERVVRLRKQAKDSKPQWLRDAEEAMGQEITKAEDLKFLKAVHDAAGKPPLKQTHTYAELGVPREMFSFVARKLREAGYDHAFVDDAIDMTGIGLVEETL